MYKKGLLWVEFAYEKSAMIRANFAIPASIPAATSMACATDLAGGSELSNGKRVFVGGIPPGDFGVNSCRNFNDLRQSGIAAAQREGGHVAGDPCGPDSQISHA
jgi:hypothetical protein